MQDDLRLYFAQKDFADKIRLYLHEKELSTGNKPKFYTHTFGCQQNESDTEKINGILTEIGYEKTAEKEIADIIIYNTCAVRENAEQRVFGTIGSLVHIKRKNPSVIIGFCGCMMQQDAVVSELQSKYKHVTLVFGTRAIHRLPQNLYKVMCLGEKVYDTDGDCDAIAEDIPIKRENNYKAWVTAMYGCNNFCTYCIVPHVRGRERSRLPENILSEVSDLVKNGYKDITLLGQNVNSYYKDIGSDWNFAKLLREIDKIEGDFRIRFMTSHPKDASRELIDTIADHPKLCNHIHLPFQSGSDRILEKMNRHYTRKNYLDLIEYARKKIPDLILTSDVIVGFPTETDEDFEKTISLVEEIGFGGLFTFIYSPRRGTPAAKMEKVDSKTVHSRFERLLELQTRKSIEINSRYIGKKVRVLVEGFTDSSKQTQTGRTEGNIIVNFPSKNIKEGTFTEIKIIKALNWAIFGE